MLHTGKKNQQEIRYVAIICIGGGGRGGKKIIVL